VPILAGDTPETLGARVFEAEQRLYPEAIRRHVASRPELFGDLTQTT
jgi:folate-dependent phosphoribosylglycinamide formyltransferase PurN